MIALFCLSDFFVTFWIECHSEHQLQGRYPYQNVLCMPWDVQNLFECSFSVGRKTINTQNILNVLCSLFNEPWHASQRALFDMVVVKHLEMVHWILFWIEISGAIDFFILYMLTEFENRLLELNSLILTCFRDFCMNRWLLMNGRPLFLCELMLESQL